MEVDKGSYLDRILVVHRNIPLDLLGVEDIDLVVVLLQVVVFGHTFVSLVVAEIAAAVVVVEHLVHLADIVLWKRKVHTRTC